MIFTKRDSKIMGSVVTPTARSQVRNAKGRMALFLATLLSCAAATAGLLDRVHPTSRVLGNVDDNNRVTLGIP